MELDFDFFTFFEFMFSFCLESLDETGYEVREGRGKRGSDGGEVKSY